MSSPYNTPAWYAVLRADSNPSAREIVPSVMDLVHPQSVVDVGCGTGGWLAVFRAAGVETIRGVDGDYTDRAQLEIPVENFTAADLTQPLQLGQRYDLAACLEVAEHLPPANAPVIVESLCRLAPVVLFSAAIPFQGGTHHINEQWPDYWQALFAKHGYAAVDCLRLRFWQNESVASHYAQNLLLFVDENKLAHYPALQREPGPVRRLVHPKRYLQTACIAHFPFRQVLKALPGFVYRYCRWHHRRLLGKQ